MEVNTARYYLVHEQKGRFVGGLLEEDFDLDIEVVELLEGGFRYDPAESSHLGGLYRKAEIKIKDLTRKDPYDI